MSQLVGLRLLNWAYYMQQTLLKPGRVELDQNLALNSLQSSSYTKCKLQIMQKKMSHVLYYSQKSVWLYGKFAFVTDYFRCTVTLHNRLILYFSVCSVLFVPPDLSSRTPPATDVPRLWCHPSTSGRRFGTWLRCDVSETSFCML